MPQVSISQIVEVPMDELWDQVRHFASIGDWHPLIEESSMEEGKPGDQLGAVRNLLAEGEHHRDRPQEMSDLDHYYKYTLVDASLPVENYVATFRLTEVSEGDRTPVEWFCQFDISPSDQEQTVNMLEEVFRNGVNVLKRRMENG